MDDPKTKRSVGGGISSLPDSIIEHILSFLPLREAVKSSVLSKAWKHKWVTRPALAFDDHFWTGFPYFQTSYNYFHSHDPNNIDKLIANVFKVLCFHQGPLRELSLSNSYLKGYPAEVDQILRYLDGKCIENLCIKIDGYKLSSRVFSFTKLKTLQLSGSVFTSSHVSFQEFGLLTRLDLMAVKFHSNVDHVSLIIKCSSLESFTWFDSGRPSYNVAILIEAPNLKRFRLLGSFRSSLRVNLAPRLMTVSVHPDTRFTVDNPISLPTSTDFIQFLDACPALQRLGTTIDLIKDFVMTNRLPRQQVPLNMLMQLRLYEVCLSKPNDVRLLVALLHRPPALQELVISTQMKADQNLEGSLIRIIEKEYYEDLKHKANRLRRVNVQRLLGTKFEMVFIRWLLVTSPELEKMRIDFSTKSVPSDQIQCYKELNQFQRASNRAQIIF